LWHIISSRDGDEHEAQENGAAAKELSLQGRGGGAETSKRWMIDKRSSKKW